MHRLADLRDILRYVPQYRDRTFVIALDGAIVAVENFHNLLLDIALLRSLRSGVVTNSNVVGRGLFRALRHVVDGAYREAGVEAIAAVTAPALMSYATTCALVMDVVDGAYDLADPALQDPDIRRFPQPA